MSKETFKYHYLKYNRFHVLRPNFFVRIIWAFYLKDLFLAFVVGASTFKARGASKQAAVILDISNPRFMLASLPIVLLCYALAHRQPMAGRRIRWIWRNGQHLILTAALMNSAMVLMSYQRFFVDGGWILMGALVINIFTIIYVYRSEEVRDLFTEFPTPPAPTT